MQRNYDIYFDIAAPGLIYGLGNPRVTAKVNGNNAAADLWEIDLSVLPTTSIVGTTYSVTVNGVTSSYKVMASSDDIANKLYGVMAQNPILGGIALVNYDETDKILAIEGLVPAQALTVVASNPLSPTNTVVAGSLPLPIPFGRVVTRKDNYYENEASLPTAPTDKPLGISMATHAIQRSMGYSSVNQMIQGHTLTSAPAAYSPGETINILDRTSDLKGIWVEAVEMDIKTSDPVYVAVSAGNEGKVTKTPAGAINISSVAAFKTPSQQVGDKILILLSFNLP